MPTYYLHQSRPDSFITDEEGAEFQHITDAIGEAAQAAREIMADRLISGEALDASEFRITDSSGDVIAVVGFREVADGKPFPPAPHRCL